MGQTSAIREIEIVFLVLLLFVVIFTGLARKLKVPYPIVLVIAGLVLGFIPGIPNVHLEPDLIFLLVLPPLLYSAGWMMPWRDFRNNIVSILLLAFGLVGFTVVGVAATAHWAFPGFDLRLGFALGAVVATTDAIAATSILKRLGLPRRLVDVLEGESLVNDATGLLALDFATAMVVKAQTPTLAAGALRLAYLVAAGIAIGLAIGMIVRWIQLRIDDGPIEILISILVPYAVYLAGESAHASGVLAVVACGLYVSRHDADFLSPTVRLQTAAVWNSLTFALNGLVFVLLGLQLPYVMAGLHAYSTKQLIIDGALFSAIVIVLRLLWMYPGAYFAHWIRTRLLHQRTRRPAPKEIFVVGWTGMRGVLALAAAISFPIVLADGSPFPKRNLIIFLAFSVIFVTLVLQGLTLPPLIRALGLAQSQSSSAADEREARRIIASAALAHLEESRAQHSPEFAELYDELAHHYLRRLSGLSKAQKDGAQGFEESRRYRALTAELLKVERTTVLRLRNEGTINDDVLRKIQRELDLSESRLSLR